MTHIPSTGQVRDAYVRNETSRDKDRDRYQPGELAHELTGLVDSLRKADTEPAR